MPSARRLTTLVGAAFVGLAATAMFASPASAHDAELTGKSVCDPSTGTFRVTWTLTNDNEKTAKVTEPKFSVNQNGQWKDGTGTVKTTDLPGNGRIEVAVQTGVPSRAVAKLKVHVTWYKKEGGVSYQKDVYGKEIQCGECKVQSPSPTPSAPEETPSPSPSGGTAGGEGSPTPTPSRTSAAPALPVTGSQTGILAGGAVALLGAGAGLFFMARRRRVTFEA